LNYGIEKIERPENQIPFQEIIGIKGTKQIKIQGRLLSHFCSSFTKEEYDLPALQAALGYGASQIFIIKLFCEVNEICNICCKRLVANVLADNC
jgi:hypothetical protein